MARHIKFYDSIGMELLGSDGSWFFDQRWSNSRARKEAYLQTQKQACSHEKNPDMYIKPRQCYVAILDDAELSGGQLATLENPLYPDTY